MEFAMFMLVGVIVGWVASLIFEGHGLGICGDFILGIGGAVTTGLLFNAYGIAAYGFWTSTIAGAVAFLFLIRAFSGTYKKTLPALFP